MNEYGFYFFDKYKKNQDHKKRRNKQTIDRAQTQRDLNTYTKRKEKKKTNKRLYTRYINIRFSKSSG